MSHRAASLSLCLLILVVAASAAIWSKSEKVNVTSETKTPMANQFWYNDVTKESRWALPEYEFTSDAGIPYWVDPVTKESVWEKPESLSWTVHESEKGTFYHNAKTGESTWEKPEMLAWRQVPVERTEL